MDQGSGRWVHWKRITLDSGGTSSETIDADELQKAYDQMGHILVYCTEDDPDRVSVQLGQLYSADSNYAEVLGSKENLIYVADLKTLTFAISAGTISFRVYRAANPKHSL